ncbi:hypothetical protein VOLCADRAFT_86741 [Volvox carteri f. nagariensis]|uniref:Peptidase M11 gametolysin domain-containing protein n=1 Tax=Volvox carteri f. nagariensis TaxID=3068 RepID=D8TJH2_VOLCA|nr:uncharacterized protein VOLCADRAFT_86741 [Volvox carteri f. nagariensis]EFJ52540.1 hypothetical protein VOLCADRAFT_86741 [Volvox carteri f. nagariensis]|eukprot:XP_002946613.1 hypothetical protein VOLCADRAFT_86741 [Volvox carteri f. nagariensis]
MAVALNAVHRPGDAVYLKVTIMWHLFILFAMELMHLDMVGASTTAIPELLKHQLAEREGRIRQSSVNFGRQRRGAVASKENPLDNTLGVLGDLRWVAPDLRLIIFIVNMCDKGGGVATSKEGVWNLLRDGSTNLADYWQTCSYGRTLLDLNGTTVVGPILMPCSGPNWTVSSCRGTNPYGWFYWLEEYATEKLSIDLSQYNHRVMIMPRGHQGFQNWQLGWSSPFVLLQRGDLRAGETVRRWIPAAGKEPDHPLRISLPPGFITVDRSGVPPICLKQLWVSYRTSSSQYDLLWREEGVGVVYVHMWADYTFSSSVRPMLVASLAVPNVPAPSDVQRGTPPPPGAAGTPGQGNQQGSSTDTSSKPGLIYEGLLNVDYTEQGAEPGTSDVAAKGATATAAAVPATATTTTTGTAIVPVPIAVAVPVPIAVAVPIPIAVAVAGPIPIAVAVGIPFAVTVLIPIAVAAAIAIAAGIATESIAHETTTATTPKAAAGGAGPPAAKP